MKKEENATSKNNIVEVKNNVVTLSKKILNILNNVWNKIILTIKKIAKMHFGKFSGTHVLVVGALALLLLFFMFKGIFGHDGIDYPVIYNNNDGDLYLMDRKTKNDDKAIKLANGESVSNVIYANTTNRYVLFQKNEALYLYDSKEKDETTKVVSDVSGYAFTEDDKYIVALDEDDNLKVYNYKETKKIESDVSNIVAISKDYILYEKENNLYVRSVNPKKDDRLKVTDDYDTYIHFSEDGKNVLYINNDRELYSFNIRKDEDKKIAKNVRTYYCDTESCEKLFYVENDETKSVYYYDGNDSQKVAKDIYSVNAYDVENKQLVYATLEDGKYNLYYQKATKDAVLIEDELESVRTVKIFDGKAIYYITGENEAKYVKINGAKIGNIKSIGEDVTGYFYLHKNGYVFVSDVKDNEGTLCLAKNGSVKEIDDDVNTNLITIGENGKSIYYLKDYNTSGDLYVSKGGKGREIEKDVYSYEYVKDDLIYLIKDYSVSKSRGDLYRYTNKSVQVAEDVTRIASSPVYFELN